MTATCLKVSVLALLDLSAAFHTVDHDIWLTRLKVSFGVSGAALDWFQSDEQGEVCATRFGSVDTKDHAVWRVTNSHAACPGPPIVRLIYCRFD